MAFSGALVASTLSSKGDITKSADADASVILAHGLGARPDFAIVTAVSGAEAAWAIGAIDATNVTLVASIAVGSAASTASVVCGRLHSLIS